MLLKRLDQLETASYHGLQLKVDRGDASGGYCGTAHMPNSSLLQVVMFSATSTQESEKTAAKWLQKPERIQVSSSGGSISSSVVQAVHVCAEHKKPQKLLKHLHQVKVSYLVVKSLKRCR